MIAPETIRLVAGDNVPNSCLPVLIYRGVGAVADGDLLALFARNRWSNGWRNGIFPFHHFHATAHEVLGIATGGVDVQLGGESGPTVKLTADDVVVLPAGTGHRRLSSPAGLEVVGAYPKGCDWDLIRADTVDAGAYAEALARIGTVPIPSTDPVCGATGPLLRLWPA